SCARRTAMSWHRPMCGPAKATSCRRASPTASSTPAEAHPALATSRLGHRLDMPGRGDYSCAMSIRPYRDIVRRRSRRIMVGSVPVGGDSPITVQTMTNTLTADAQATIDQIRRSEEAGVDIVRVSCPDEASTAALSAIVKASKVPIVADIHFHYR